MTHQASLPHHRMLGARLLCRACWCSDGCVASGDALFFSFSFLTCDLCNHSFHFVDRTPHTRLFFAHIAPCSHAPHGSRRHKRLCTNPSLPSTSMFDERSLIFPRPILCLLSSTLFFPTPTSTMSPSVNPATIARYEEHCDRLATSTPLTGHEPNELDVRDVTHNPSIFQSSSVTSEDNVGENRTDSLDPGIDDEHIRNMLASPLYLQEKEASADLTKAFHANAQTL